MRKAIAGVTCVLMAIVIAVVTTGCKKNSGELTFSGNVSTSSTTNRIPVSNSVTEPSNEPSSNLVIYHLTTTPGETIPTVIPITESTDFSSVNYDPVTVPTMPTTYVNPYPGTTSYEPPTHSYDNPTTTTQPTTEPTTEKPMKYKSVDNKNASFEDSVIKVFAENVFGNEIVAKKGTVTINYGSTTYKADCKVLSKLYAGEEVEIDIGIPTALISAIETNEQNTLTIIVPKGLIVSKDNVSNQEFRVSCSV